MKFELFAIFLLLSPVIVSFSCIEHMIVWKISQSMLSSELYDSIIKLAEVKDYWYTNELELACWADDVRWRDSEHSHWHFLDIPFFDGVEPFPWEPPADNVAYGMQILREEMQAQGSDQNLRSKYVKYFIHFMGDLHTPMHTVSRYSPEHPEGDRGGNDFKVSGMSSKGIRSLHSLWDRSMGQIDHPSRKPLTDESQAYISDQAKMIMQEFPQSSLRDELAEDDFLKRAYYPNSIAVSLGYNGINPGEKPSDEYISSRFEMGKKLLAIAGYKLGEELNEMIIA